MPKKTKFNKDKQYYIDLSTEMILENIKNDHSDVDILGHKRDQQLVTSLEGGVYTRSFNERDVGGIDIFTLDKLDQYAEYLTQVTLPVDDPTFEVKEGGFLRDLSVNKVILGQGYDLCDINSLDTLGIKVTKDIVRQIGKKDRVDTLQALLNSNRIKKSWGNIVIEWANKVETLEWAHTNLTCNTDEDDGSLSEAFYTSFLDVNYDKIKWLLEHDFEIGHISNDQLKDTIKAGRIDVFELLKEHEALEELSFSSTLASGFKFNQLELCEWIMTNLEPEDLNKDVSLAVIRAFGDYDSDRLGLSDDRHYYNTLTPTILEFLSKHNITLDNDSLEVAFLNSCEHNTISNIEYFFEHYDVMGNANIKNESIGIATKYSSMEVFNILTNKFGQNGIDIYEAVFNASVAGNIEILNQLYDTQKEAFMKVMNRKDFDSSTAILEKYKNHSEYIVSQSTGHIEVLKWYRTNGLFSVNTLKLFDIAFSKGQVDTLTWLESEYKPNYIAHFNDKYFHISRNFSQSLRRQSMLACDKNDSESQENPIVKSLKWLKDKNFVFGSHFKKELFEFEHIGIFNKSNDVLDWLKDNVLTSADALELARNYTGEYSHMKDRLNWLLRNYPEHSEFINLQMAKTSRSVVYDENTDNYIDDYGDDSSKKSGKKSKMPQCAQS
jgi:hypothetical protein